MTVMRIPSPIIESINGSRGDLFGIGVNSDLDLVDTVDIVEVTEINF